jgi:hypothetical protein
MACERGGWVTAGTVRCGRRRVGSSGDGGWAAAGDDSAGWAAAARLVLSQSGHGSGAGG